MTEDKRTKAGPAAIPDPPEKVEPKDYAVPPSDENDSEQMHRAAVRNLEESRNRLKQDDSSAAAVLADRNRKRKIAETAGALVFSAGAAALMFACACFYVLVNLWDDVEFFFFDSFGQTFQAVMKEPMTRIMIMLCAGGAAVVIGLVLLFARTGPLNEDGLVRLNRFDRAFLEVDGMLGAGVIAGIAGCTALNAYWFMQSDYLYKLVSGLMPDYSHLNNGMTPDHAQYISLWRLMHRTGAYDPEHFSVDANAALVLFIIAAALLSLGLAVIMASIVRRIKARCFWNHTVLGWLIIRLIGRYRSRQDQKVKTSSGADEPDAPGNVGKENSKSAFSAVSAAAGLRNWIRRFWRYEAAVIVLLLLFIIFVCEPEEAGVVYTVFGFIAATLALFLGVPHYRKLRTGLDRLAAGDLSYRIPLKGRGPIAHIARDVNTIAGAQAISVQHELRKDRLRSELISNVSHDLKTPLTSMVTYVDLLRTEGLDSPNAPEYLNILDEKTQRLRVLVQDLFEAAKASSGDLPVHLAPLNLDVLVRQAAAEFQDDLAERGIELIMDLGDSVPGGMDGGSAELDNAEEEEMTAGETAASDADDMDRERLTPESHYVLADGDLLWRVMNNLMSNLCKYAQPGSRAYLEIQALDKTGSDGSQNANGKKRSSTAKQTQQTGWIVMTLKNISESPLNISVDELMERFRRGDSSRSTDGSGLGLTIAGDLTRLMGGRFQISIDGDLFKAGVELRKCGKIQQ